MATKPYDPLRFVPSPDVVREQLNETLTLTNRLRVLLEFSERIHAPQHQSAGDRDGLPAPTHQ